LILPNLFCSLQENPVKNWIPLEPEDSKQQQGFFGRTVKKSGLGKQKFESKSSSGKPKGSGDV
jgi:hypothetical protein